MPRKGSESKAADGARGEKRLLASNRKARHDYAIEAVIEAGLVLFGSEVKSLRSSNPTITDGYARVERDELWLHSVHIPQLPQASYLNHEPVRPRKCLVHRREKKKLEDRLAVSGTTIVPLSMYFLGHRVKVELGVGRGRRKGDKREAEREKEDRKKMRASGGRGSTGD